MRFIVTVVSTGIFNKKMILEFRVKKIRFIDLLGKSQELVGGGNSFGHVGRHFRRRRCLSRNVTKA